MMKWIWIIFFLVSCGYPKTSFKLRNMPLDLNDLMDGVGTKADIQWTFPAKNPDLNKSSTVYEGNN